MYLKDARIDYTPEGYILRLTYAVSKLVSQEIKFIGGGSTVNMVPEWFDEEEIHKFSTREGAEQHLKLLQGVYNGSSS